MWICILVQEHDISNHYSDCIWHTSSKGAKLPIDMAMHSTAHSALSTYLHFLFKSIFEWSCIFASSSSPTSLAQNTPSPLKQLWDQNTFPTITFIVPTLSPENTKYWLDVFQKAPCFCKSQFMTRNVHFSRGQSHKQYNPQVLFWDCKRHDCIWTMFKWNLSCLIHKMVQTIYGCSQE